MKTTTLFALVLASAFLPACQNGQRGPLPALEQSTDAQERADLAAAPSPDGKRIVFSAHGALWVMAVEGGSALRISNWALAPAHPVWSPDGKRIAFQNDSPQGSHQLWTIDPDGRHASAWTAGPWDDREPAWLPDGSGLVFSSNRGNDGQYRIWRLRLADRSLAPLTGSGRDPAVSPDGARLAYVDAARVMTVALDGEAAPATVAPGAAPAWRPDGAALVYQDAVHRLVVAGRQVGGEALSPSPVRFLPDGRMLYTADGKIRMRDSAGANPADIAFRTMLAAARREHGTTRR